MTSNNEEFDLKMAKRKAIAEKDLAFSMIKMILSEPNTPEALRSFGYKSHEQAIVSIVKDTIKKVDAIWAEHIKKYPD